MNRRAALSALAVSLLLLSSIQSANTAVSGVEWPYTNATPDGTNYVAQDQLTQSNANGLVLAWSFPFPSASPPAGLNFTGQGSIAPPLVVGGMVYVVMNDLEVLGINAGNGAIVWRYQPALNRSDLPLGILAGHVHGLTYHDGSVWLSLPDCSALSLNALSGAVEQRIERICAGIPGNGGKYDYSGTPVVFYRDVLIWTASSVSEGTDAGRGFVAAYNTSDGRLLWRWYVSPPAGGDPNWDSNSCPPPCHGNVTPVPGDWGTLGTVNGTTRAGASPAWGQPAVDSHDGIVVLGTSQPSPDWNATLRPGPNLYSDSLVALNVTTGKLLWFYQTTPHDLYDFDCGWNVALGNVTIGGENHEAVFKACKNGYVYALDARSGGLLWYFSPPTLKRLNTPNSQYVVTGSYDGNKLWANSPSASSYVQCPGIDGGVESDIAVAYGKVFVATHNFCAVVTPAPVNGIGGTISGASGIQYDMLHANTTIYALDQVTGRSLWTYNISSIPYRGWLTASGGMVFASTLGGEILALDASSGALVGSTNVGSGLYEGVTMGTDLGGALKVFQLTSSPAYGAFTSGVPGALLAFTPGEQQTDWLAYLTWVAVGGVAAAAIMAVAILFVRRRGAHRESESGLSRITYSM